MKPQVDIFLDEGEGRNDTSIEFYLDPSHVFSISMDATTMPDLDVAEMCADWMAMSKELGGNPKDWADKNVNIRWKFTDDQKKMIYEIIGECWE